MNIYIKPDATLSGVYRARYGKRRVIISMPKMDILCGLSPSDAAIRTAFNDCSGPKDAVLMHMTPIIRES